MVSGACFFKRLISCTSYLVPCCKLPQNLVPQDNDIYDPIVCTGQESGHSSGVLCWAQGLSRTSVLVSSRLVVLRRGDRDLLSSSRLWSLAGSSFPWAVGLSFPLADGLRVPSAPRQVGLFRQGCLPRRGAPAAEAAGGCQPQALVTSARV